MGIGKRGRCVSSGCEGATEEGMWAGGCTGTGDGTGSGIGRGSGTGMGMGIGAAGRAGCCSEPAAGSTPAAVAGVADAPVATAAAVDPTPSFAFAAMPACPVARDTEPSPAAQAVSPFSSSSSSSSSSVCAARRCPLALPFCARAIALACEHRGSDITPNWP